MMVSLESVVPLDYRIHWILFQVLSDIRTKIIFANVVGGRHIRTPSPHATMELTSFELSTLDTVSRTALCPPENNFRSYNFANFLSSQ